MRFLSILCLTAGLFYSSTSVANVVISGTRVVYPAQSKEISIQLNNAGKNPALVQTWITDASEDRSKPTPFVLTPPVFRMEGNKKQTLRVIYTHEQALAQDRETLFYFNLLDIPPTPKAEDLGGKNYLQFSLMSKLKFFYRPQNLKPSIDQAYQQLTVQQNSTGVTIQNPTPYYITVSKVTLLANKDDTTPLGETDLTPMIEPFGKADVKLSVPSNAKIAQVEYVNDYGTKASVPITLTASK